MTIAKFALYSILISKQICYLNIEILAVLTAHEIYPAVHQLSYFDGVAKPDILKIKLLPTRR
ncbi:MAG: hypothetical protein LBR84_10070 [Tannerella sp.]|nr:hypothetical protein [Tannerella sp.]